MTTNTIARGFFEGNRSVRREPNGRPFTISPSGRQSSDDFAKEIGNIFHVRVCSPVFVDTDVRSNGKWRVEMDNFSDREIRR